MSRNPDQLGAKHPGVRLGDFYPGATRIISAPMADFHRADRHMIDGTKAFFELALRGQVDAFHVFVPWLMTGGKSGGGECAFPRAVGRAGGQSGEGTVERFTTRRADERVSRTSTGDGAKPRRAIANPIRPHLKRFLALLTCDCFHAMMLHPEPMEVNGSGDTIIASEQIIRDRYARFVGKPELAAHPEAIHA